MDPEPGRAHWSLRTLRTMRAVVDPFRTVLGWFTEPAPPRARRRVHVSAEGEVTHVEVVAPRPPAALLGPYPYLDGDAHAVDRRALGIVLGTDGRRHPAEDEGPWFLLDDGPLVGGSGYPGWSPTGPGHGVPPGTDVALCGATARYVWLGPFVSESTERVVQQCPECLTSAAGWTSPPPG